MAKRLSIYCTALALQALVLAPVAAQYADDPEATEKVLKGRPYSPYADRAFPADVYFGDTHVHTPLSADAGGGGTKLLPRDAYRFARCEQVVSNTGQPVKLSRPLDFYMITDHSDGMGVITDILGGAPGIMADPVGREFHDAFNAGGEQAAKAAFELTRRFSQGEIPEALNYQPGNPAFRRVWDDIVAAAEEFNDPGVFTTFIAFEWTSLVAGNNLHRNVIFRDGPERAGQIEPYTTTPPIGSRNPRDLWAWLQNYEDKTGGDVLAIPHNGNLSNGMMFALQDDFADGAAARRRLCRAAREVGAALRGDPDEGRRRGAPAAVARGRVRRFRDLGLGQSRPTSEDARNAGRRILRSGLQRGLSSRPSSASTRSSSAWSAPPTPISA